MFSSAFRAALVKSLHHSIVALKLFQAIVKYESEEDNDDKSIPENKQ